ncbi:MAG: Rho termination factor N-terminal domain-containing protein [bacterium]|nr:Rho termination factor N-terminal domain-containing protein [bacterium]
MLIRELLAKKKVTDLREIAKASGLKGYSKLKKDDLTSLIEEAIINEEYVQKVVFFANNRELALFERKLTENVPFVEDDIISYLYMYKSLFYFMNEENPDENEFLIPDDIKALYEKVFTKEFKSKRDRFQLVADYIVANANMYGMVPVEQVVKTFNEQNKTQTNGEEVLKVYNLISGVKQIFYKLVDGQFVHEAVLEENGMSILAGKQGNKPYYVPSKEILINYAREEYFERSMAFEALVAFLEHNVIEDDILTEKICTEIQYLYCFGEELQQGITVLEDYGIEMEEDQLKIVIDLLVNVYNNSRFWENRGFSPVEMNAIENVDAAVGISANNTIEKAKKVGRNDKCPCGSGKKYKFCCGK